MGFLPPGSHKPTQAHCWAKPSRLYQSFARQITIPAKGKEAKQLSLSGPLQDWEDHAQSPDFSELLCENSGAFPLL